MYILAPEIYVVRQTRWDFAVRWRNASSPGTALRSPHRKYLCGRSLWPSVWVA